VYSSNIKYQIETIMNKIYLSSLLIIAMISCSNEHDIINQPSDVEKNTEVNRVLKTSKKDVLLFMDKVLPTVSNLSIKPEEDQNQRERSFENKQNLLGGEIESIIPIMKNDEVVRWAVNFENDNGYILLAANKTEFPIIGFQEKGRYIPYSESYINDDIELTMASENMVNFNDTINNTNFRMWEELLNCDDDESFEIEFIAQDVNEEINTKNALMPDRDKPLNRKSMYSLGWNLQWGEGDPYNFEIYKKHSVPAPALALAHYMYIERYPSHKYGFMYMPERVPRNSGKTRVSSLLKDITEDLSPSYHTDQTKTTIINSSILPRIPRILEKEYDFAYGGDLVWYKNDEESFEKVHRELLQFKPVLFFYHSIQAGANSGLYYHALHAWVVDGYREIQVKYTKTKKTVLGITVSKKEWYGYKDFFHRIGENEANTGWFSQEDAQPGYHPENHKAQMAWFKKYALLNVRKY